MTRAYVEVRDATSSDVAQLLALCLVARLELAISRDDEIEAVTGQVADLVADPQTTVCVAVTDQRIVGISIIRTPVPNPLAAFTSLTIESIFVHPDHRRKGIGHALLNRVVIVADEHAAENVVANPPAGLRIVNRFLARLGFVSTESRRVVSRAALRRALAKSSEPGRRGRSIEELVARRRQQAQTGQIPRYPGSGPAPRVRVEPPTPPRGGNNLQVKRALATRRSA